MMKLKTAMRILENRAFKFYGLTFDAYIELLTNCGGTQKEEEAYNRYLIEMMR